MGFKKKKQNLDVTSDDSVKKALKSSNSFFNWIQEFSKWIIIIVAVIYVVINAYCIGMMIYTFQITKEVQCLDTLIMEIHQTFREVVGGYIIKAAVENVSKYSGAIIDKWLELRLDRQFGRRETEDSVIEERDGLTWKKLK